MKNKKTSHIEKKLNSLTSEIERIKNHSLILWTEVKKFNVKNNYTLRQFEDFLVGKLISDLRTIQNEHLSALKALIREKDAK